MTRRDFLNCTAASVFVAMAPLTADHWTIHYKWTGPYPIFSEPYEELRFSYDIMFAWAREGQPAELPDGWTGRAAWRGDVIT